MRRLPTLAALLLLGAAGTAQAKTYCNGALGAGPLMVSTSVQQDGERRSYRLTYSARLFNSGSRPMRVALTRYTQQRWGSARPAPAVEMGARDVKEGPVLIMEGIPEYAMSSGNIMRPDQVEMMLDYRCEMR